MPPSLPLFPLSTVLFPGARLPLQLFEPRYLALAQDLGGRDEDERHFGVLLIRQGHEVGEGSATTLATTGCEARVDAMAVDHTAGRPVVHLVATGVRRFRLEAVDEAAGTPYLTGSVHWLVDPPDEADALAVSDARSALARYDRALGRSATDAEAASGQLAYRLAERAVLDAADRQRVLEGSTEAERLQVVTGLLRREAAMVRQFHSLPRLESPGGAGLN